MSGMIGQRIKELRTKKGITQEELGRKIGITAQGVSKWERGTSPDAELLPKIAELLGVSVDSLFGEHRSLSTDEAIIKKLGMMPEEEAFKRAFELCWAIEMGLTGKNTLKDKFTPDILDTLKDENGSGIYSKLIFDSGIVSARLSTDGKYIFFMPEPQDGLDRYLGDMENAAALFGLLSDKNALLILKYLYGRKNTPVSLSKISIKTGIEKTTALNCLNRLCEKGLTECTEIDTESCIIKSYTYSREATMIPLLIYAKEMRCENILHFVGLYKRNKPLLSGE